MLVLVLGFAHRNHAPVGHFADHIFELNGGMGNVKILAQAVFHVAQNALADRRRNVGNRNVAGKRPRPDPMLQTCRSWTSFTPSIFRIAASTCSSLTPRGVPSRRMLRVSRTMPKPDHRMRHLIRTDTTESIEYWPVDMMAEPPAMTAAVESVSPIRAERRCGYSHRVRHDTAAARSRCSSPCQRRPRRR